MQKNLVAAVSLLVATVFCASPIRSETVGVTATEIKIGASFPFSGPASAFGLIGTGLSAYIKSINDRGGINGRMINYITLDDAYSPPKTVEHVRRLVESDEVAFLYSQLGTPGNSAISKYLQSKKVPNIAIVSGASKFSNRAEYPYTTVGLVNYEMEGTIYAKFLTSTMPNDTYALLYQNDDLGKDYLNAFRNFFKDKFDTKVVAVSYEVMDPTVDSQIVKLKTSGAKALVIAGSPKFAAQAIRKSSEIGWDAVRIVNFPSSSIGGTLRPAGLENSIGVITATLTKDVTDPKWADDEGMKEYKAFFDKYLTGSDFVSGNYLVGFQQGKILERILTACGSDLSRENILKQARNVRGFRSPVAMLGIEVNTRETDNAMWRQLQLQKWSGTKWEQIGGVLDAEVK